MSGRVLSRERGTVIVCNGCGRQSSTGQFRLEDHRAYLTTLQWGRGINAGTKTESSTRRHDLCPPCKDKDRALHAERKRFAAERKAARDQARKLTPEQRIERLKERRARDAKRRKEKRAVEKAAQAGVAA